MELLRRTYLNDRFFYAMAACVALFLMSYTFAWLFPVALAAVILILCMLTGEGILVFRKKNISAERFAAPVFSLHDKNEIRLVVQNQGRYTLRLRIIDELPYQFNKRDLSFNISLGPGEAQKLAYELTPSLRGAYHFGDLRVFVSVRPGFLSCRETIPAERTVAVYPSLVQMARQQMLALNHPAFSSGANRSRRFGQSYEFDQVKAYVPGDDTRNINWKASSTMGEVMVNMYEDERAQPVYSVIDKSRVMKTPFNELPLVDHAINATLAFSNIVLKKQDRAGLLIYSKQVTASLKAERGPRQLKKIMYALYKESYDYSEADYENLYITIRRTINTRSLIFLYTNFDTLQGLDRCLKIMRLINKHHLLVVVFFENTEMEEYAKSEAGNLLDIYQLTMARRFLHEKSQIARELERQGIQSIRCRPEDLSSVTIHKYLDLKVRGRI